MLQPLDRDVWLARHRLTALGLPISTCMTVLRLGSGGLWLHSPIPLDADLRAELLALGPVRHVVAPNRHHHKFFADALAAFPEAVASAAPGLPAALPDLVKPPRVLGPAPEPDWRDELDQVLIDGMPFVNEVAFFHRRSATLILTDLCQCMKGDDLPWRTRVFATLVGVRDRLAVPRTVRLVTRDRAAARASVRRVLAWPFRRVVLGHEVVVERDAHARLSEALSWFEA